eukprot:CAMPEP_0117453932 /NCGR_PEP_ID=MMETSP0759-20121206/10510_1 /TAXON_ID=63605 /ORGANISM="Percolomonas cosmopolitus, Strain WS" /LENGTH=836 /DNA_ID=CAMNT_0005247043 /DNA_START=312 /DNA_END=2822 /DNA_ORIENTATION=-
MSSPTSSKEYRSNRNAPHFETLRVVTPSNSDIDNSTHDRLSDFHNFEFPSGMPLSSTGSNSSFSDMVNQAILDADQIGSARASVDAPGGENSPIMVQPRKRSLSGRRAQRMSSQSSPTIRTQSLASTNDSSIVVEGGSEGAPTDSDKKPSQDLGPVAAHLGAAKGEHMRVLPTFESTAPLSVTPSSLSTNSPSGMLISTRSDEDTVHIISSGSSPTDDESGDYQDFQQDEASNFSPNYPSDYETIELQSSPPTQSDPESASTNKLHDLSPLPKTRITIQKQDFLRPRADNSAYEIQVSSPFTPDSSDASYSVPPSPNSEESLLISHSSQHVRTNSDDAHSPISSNDVSVGLATPHRVQTTSSSNSSSFSSSKRNQIIPFSRDDGKDVEEIPGSPSSIDSPDSVDIIPVSLSENPRKRKSPLGEETPQRITPISKFSDSCSSHEDVFAAIDVKPKRKLHNKPSTFFFFQQRFPEIPSTMCYEWYWMSINFAILFLIATIIGIAIAVGSSSVSSRILDVNYSDPVCKEISLSNWTGIENFETDPRLADLRVPQNRSQFLCQIELYFAEEWEPPIYIHYELTNFFQSHRDYSVARSNKQLGGRAIDFKTARAQCADYVSYYDGQQDNSELVIHPCGAIAHSMFNDTFVLFDKGKNVQICNTSNIHEDHCTSNGIVYSSQSIHLKTLPEVPEIENVERLSLEKEIYFNKTGMGIDFYPQEPTHIIPKITDELREWMRSAPFPNLVKAHRIIDTPLFGNYTMYIHSVFPVKNFGGEKKFVFRALTWTGSGNWVLAIFYFIMAAICGIVSFCCVGIGVSRFIKFAKSNVGENQGELLETTIE